MKKALLIPTVMITLITTSVMSCSKSNNLNPVYDDKGGSTNNPSDDPYSRKSGTQAEDSSKPKGADDSSKTGGNGSGTTTTTPIPGSWAITYYYDKTKDETSDYAGYSYAFNTNGTMTATKGTTTVNGTWREFTSNGVKKFEIMMNVTSKPLSELNDDWAIVSKTSTEIKLKDDNPAKNEQLVFTKL